MDSVQRRTEEWKRRPAPLPAFAALVGAAYLDDELADEAVPNISGALAEVLEPGWFRDRIAPRLAVRVGDRDLLAATTAAQEARSTRLLARTRATLAVEVMLIAVALVLLVRVAVRRRAFDRISVVVLPPAWRGRDGIRVLIWGGAIGALLLFGSSFVPERPYFRVLLGATTNLSFVPLIFLAWLFLIRPSGQTLPEGFRLVPGSGRGGQRRHLRGRARLRPPRLRGGLLEGAPVGVVVRADRELAAVDGGARGRQPHGLALRHAGLAWLAATCRSIGASAIQPRPPNPLADPARPAGAGSSSTSTRRGGSTTICGPEPPASRRAGPHPRA